MPQFDITIAGEINLDLILYGLPADLPLEQELLADGLELTLGSSSAITAHNLAALGSRVGSYPGCMAEMSLAHLDLEYLKSATHFHLSSYFLHRALVPQIPHLLRELKNSGLRISLDTNDDPHDRWNDGIQDALEHVDVLMPNEREVCKLARTEKVEDAVHKLLERVPLIVLKRGVKGATAFTKTEEVPVSAFPVEVVDPVGAGDSFNAGFLHKYVQGKPLAECLAYGNLAAACSTTKPGGTEAFRDATYWRSFFASHSQRS